MRRFPVLGVDLFRGGIIVPVIIPGINVADKAADRIVLPDGKAVKLRELKARNSRVSNCMLGQVSESCLTSREGVAEALLVLKQKKHRR